MWNEFCSGELPTCHFHHLLSNWTKLGVLLLTQTNLNDDWLKSRVFFPKMAWFEAWSNKLISRAFRLNETITRECVHCDKPIVSPQDRSWLSFTGVSSLPARYPLNFPHLYMPGLAQRVHHPFLYRTSASAADGNSHFVMTAQTVKFSSLLTSVARQLATATRTWS